MLRGGVQLGVRHRGVRRRAATPAVVVVGPYEGGLGAEPRLPGPHREVLVDHRLVGVAGVVVLGGHGWRATLCAAVRLLFGSMCDVVLYL